MEKLVPIVCDLDRSAANEYLSNISRAALTNFGAKLAVSLKFAHVRDHDPVLRFHLLMRAQGRMRFAHVQFVGTEEALRAVRQGATHGFRYGQRLDVDSAPWVFYIGPAYRAVYISGWLASNRRPALLQWMYDIPNIEATAGKYLLVASLLTLTVMGCV